MPIYEYQCGKCKKIKEVIHSARFEHFIRCTKCMSQMKKIISKSSFVLKGGGWANDGYSSKKE